MLDIKLIKTKTKEIKNKLKKRNKNWLNNIDQLLTIDKERCDLIKKIEIGNADINKKTKEIAKLVTTKKDVLKEKQYVQTVKKTIADEKKQLTDIEEKFRQAILSIPNTPHESVPEGKDETQNVEIKKVLKPRKFNFKFKAHWDLAKELHLVDFERAIKLTGSRFTCYTNKGAKLIRALIQYTLDMNTKAGFIEMLPAVILNKKSLTGTGQLPKFEEDLFKLTNGFYLSPTAEVQLTNYYSNEILNKKELPKMFTANTACFRSEAGSAGKDTKGVIRQHQFYKTEMVILSLPDKSYDCLEMMTSQAEKLLETLGLPFRRIVLCSGDMGFSAAKTYDIEVWLPSYNAYKEISSCSNCEAFQARRMMLRYRDENNQVNYVHTLNGSGVAIDRLWAAVVENYQNEDGSITVPKALQKYIGESIIK